MENSQKRKAPIQPLQFTLIGISNAAVDIGSLNLLLLLSPTSHSGTLALFNTIAYCLAISNSYFWNSRITFRHSAKGSRQQQFLFVLQGLFSLLINNGVFLAFNLLLQFMEISSWISLNLSKALAMFASFAASFFMIKYFVFRDQQNRNKKP